MIIYIVILLYCFSVGSLCWHRAVVPHIPRITRPGSAGGTRQLYANSATGTESGARHTACQPVSDGSTCSELWDWGARKSIKSSSCTTSGNAASNPSTNTSKAA